MSNNKAIDIILRVRPVKKPYDGLKIDDDNQKCNIFIPKQKQSGYVNNTTENYSFQFNNVLDPDTSQETVFKKVAKDVCDQALEGYNGTVFAYGQTGSGKTFTMTGGERYDDRGLIPRTLSYLSSMTKKRDDLIFNMSVSYIQIYQGQGYDLLDEKSNNTKIEHLPKVQPRETEDEEVILSGLSVHRVDKEEDALNLLYIGDDNRVICETPKNDSSTRSHCIFIIMIESRKPDSDVKTLSRIHLVDLSGSERIGKTGVKDLLQKEARSINLTLHFLERVIVCLNKKANGENIHIPYRESLMTQILRNSLGGNCKTRMVATVSPSLEDIDESICTCKFAQRVALIKNSVERNEFVDPGIIIQRLKRENAALKAELKILKGEDALDELMPEDRERCKKQVQEFIKNEDPGAQLILNDRLKINECFYYFKQLYSGVVRQKGGKAGQIIEQPGENNMVVKQVGLNQQQGNQGGGGGENNPAQLEEIKRLKLLVQQRDNEIMILLDLINKGKANKKELVIPVKGEDKENQDIMNKSIIKQAQPITFLEQKEMLRQSQMEENNLQQQQLQQQEQSQRVGSDLTNISLPYNKNQSMESESQFNQPSSLLLSQQQKDINKMLLFPLNLTQEQLKDRVNCFELFRKSYRKNEVMEENKQILKQKYSHARELGAIVTNARNQIKSIKSQIETLRKQAAVKALVDGSEDAKHPDEPKLIQEIETLKRTYKENFDDLKELKAEIERIQLILEKSKDKLQQDFTRWIDLMMQQKKQMTQISGIGGSVGDSTQLPTGSMSINTTMNRNSMGQNIPVKTNNFMGSQDFTQNSQQFSQNPSRIPKEVHEVKDKEVEKNLENFYKMRDKIYQQ